MLNFVLTKKDSPFSSGSLENNDQKTVIIFYKMKNKEQGEKSGEQRMNEDSSTGLERRLSAV